MASQSYAIQAKCYKSFDELCDTCRNLKLPKGWSTEITEADCVLLKRADDVFELNKFEIYIGSSLQFKVRVYAWEIPKNHLLYEKYDNSMVNITISNLVCYLEGSPLCHGINDQISNWSSSFVHHSVPCKHDYTANCSRPLDEKEYARSSSCLVILLPELEQNPPCNFCTKLFRAEQRSFRQKSK